MSRTEALVHIAHLRALIDDLRDMRWHDSTPQHVVEATKFHIATLEATINEMARIHNVSA